MEHDPVTPLQNQWLALSLPNRLRFAKGSQDPSSNGGHPLLLVEHNSASKMDLGAGLMLDDVFVCPLLFGNIKLQCIFFLAGSNIVEPKLSNGYERVGSMIS